MSEEIQLQLGDIIEISAPDNDVLNKNVFLIDFIDENKIKLLDVNVSTPLVLQIEDGDLKDDTIESISLLSRSSEEGYARQNALVPQTWIDVYFSGDVPQVITGLITNLEEDMIEIKTFPSNDVIYIDFEYKGIPEALPLEKIIVRSEPTLSKQQPPEETEDTTVREEEISVEPTLVEAEPSFVERMKEIIIEADDITLGSELNEITQLVQVKEGEERFGIDNQTNDLLDDLLSTIPSTQRTARVLNDIKIMIERFVQLRNQYSVFDEYDNAIMPEIKTAQHKPLVDSISKLNKNLTWIIPVVKLIKNVYDVDEYDVTEYNDVNIMTIANSRIMDTEQISQYYDGTDNYEYLLSTIQKQGTPFNQNSENPDVIKTLEVLDNITAIVNNLEDYYSSVVKNDLIKRKRFYLQKYNTSLTFLKPTEEKDTYLRKPISNNDIMNVTSIIMLPQPLINYSKINLPTTDILNKSQLNKATLFLFKLLDSKTQVNSFTVGNKEFEFDDDNFLNNINEFIPDDGVDYETLLNNTIPRTKKIFELVKKYIRGNYTLVNLINHLEPFLVYLNDLTYKQYQIMVTYINKQILEYKKKLVSKSREFQQLQYKKLKINEILFNVYNLLNNERHPKTDEDLQKQVFIDSYQIKTISVDKDLVVPQESESELLNKMYTHDNGNLLNTTIAASNLPLFALVDIQAELEKNNEELLGVIETEKQKNTCSEYILAKRYVEFDELEDDNLKPIYFDKNLDPTHYDIINNYSQEMSSMSEEEFKEFLIEKLIQNIGLNETQAHEDAEAMIIGKRQVREGQYALLDVVDKEPLYFKRVDESWEQDELDDLNNLTITNQKMFCDLQEKCFKPTDAKICQDNVLNEGILKQKTLQQLIKEFDLKYESSKEELTQTIGGEIDYLAFVVRRLTEINENSLFKINDKQIAIGLTVEDADDKPISPHEQLRDIILSQSDFVKKQHDIVRFCYKFTRDPSKDESQYWKYCNTTNTKLLPMFIFTLASVFVEKKDYQYAIEQICAKQGKLSDDGDAWVDQYSGYIIQKIDFSTEEGFDESGFKTVSRSIIENELTVQGESNIQDPNAIIVDRIISALARYIGLEINPHKEFIIRNVILTNGQALPRKEIYEEKAELALKAKNRKLPTYEDALNSSLMLLSLTFFHIAMQISIPSIQTRKTFPGCVKSFSGFPLEGSSSYDGVIYVACVANKLKAKTKPWNTLLKMNEKGITKRIVDLINKYVVTNHKLIIKIREKQKYMLLNKDIKIPQVHNLEKWDTLLPPLKPVKLDRIDNITTEFREQLFKHLKKGVHKQHLELEVVNSKMIYFSMKIIENLSIITGKVKPLLTNAVSEPFIENACCHDDNTLSTYQYFADLNKEIHSLNDKIGYLFEIKQQIADITRPVILYNPANTKLSYVETSNDFDEKTIYLAFIKYCKFDLNVKLPADLERLCGEIPQDYNSFDSIQTTIDKFKRSGKHYTLEMMESLLLAISKRNILKINAKETLVSPIQELRVIIERLNNIDDTTVPQVLRNKLTTMLDTYDLTIHEDTEDIRSIKNYLGKQNQILKQEIINFVKQHSKIAQRKINQFALFINNFSPASKENLLDSEKEDSFFSTLRSIKSFTNDLVNVFPNIVKNNVDYESIKIPRHWKLTERHQGDVKKIIHNYYLPLLKNYDDDKLKKILNSMQKNTQFIYKFMKALPCYKTIYRKDKKMYSLFNLSIVMPLYEFLFLSSINELIILSNTSEIEIANVATEITEEDGKWAQVDLTEEQFGEITEIQIVQGDIKEQNEKVASYIFDCITIFSDVNKTAILSYDEIMKKVKRAKEMEKDEVTKRLKDMSDEQREINTLFKSYKLEEWGVGLQKGLTQYVGDTYDQEREAIERRALLEMSVGKQSMVTEMNREIFMIDEENRHVVARDIEREVNDLSHLPEDDDFADGDGDYF